MSAGLRLHPRRPRFQTLAAVVQPKRAAVSFSVPQLGNVNPFYLKFTSAQSKVFLDKTPQQELNTRQWSCRLSHWRRSLGVGKLVFLHRDVVLGVCSKLCW